MIKKTKNTTDAKNGQAKRETIAATYSAHGSFISKHKTQREERERDPLLGKTFYPSKQWISGDEERGKLGGCG